MSRWTTTSSGLQYEILESGEGATPGPTVHFPYPETDLIRVF